MDHAAPALGATPLTASLPNRPTQLVADMAAAGFVDVGCRAARAGRKRLVVITGRR
jgi:hypothetical protein